MLTLAVYAIAKMPLLFRVMLLLLMFAICCCHMPLYAHYFIDVADMRTLLAYCLHTILRRVCR